MEELRIPGQEIKLGVSACAVQTEGNDIRNTWYECYKKGYVKDGASPNDACGFYENYEREVDLMAGMGIPRFRLGVEWSRIEPARGVFNNGVIRHYRQMLEYMISKGIEPMLVLHSFADPVWFMDIGGFESEKCADIFLHYVKKAVESFGDLVSEFITMNEPNTYAINGYFYGCFPPGKQSYKTYRTVLTNMARCHMSAYGLIHSVRRQMGYDDTRVSCSIATIYHEPRDPKSGYQRRAARWLDSFCYLSFARAVLTGVSERPVKKLGMPKGCYVDFIAMNYQYGTMVTGYEERTAPEGFPVSDLGNAICPDGLVKCAMDLTGVKDLPVCVTENGVCDNEDFFRIRYIYEHLKAMAESSVFFDGYYYRSFTDSFEFLEGNFARYGLVYTDFATGEMSIKRSGEFYSDIIRNGGVTEEMTLRYAGTYYHDITGKILEGLDDVYTDRDKFLKSENGSGVITSVSGYARDPEGYDEFSVREEKGLNARTSLPEEEPVLPADAVTGANEPGGEEQVADLTLALDTILGRNDAATDLPVTEESYLLPDAETAAQDDDQDEELREDTGTRGEEQEYSEPPQDVPENDTVTDEEPPEESEDSADDEQEIPEPDQQPEPEAIDGADSSEEDPLPEEQQEETVAPDEEQENSGTPQEGPEVDTAADENEPTEDVTSEETEVPADEQQEIPESDHLPEAEAVDTPDFSEENSSDAEDDHPEGFSADILDRILGR